MYSFDHNRPSTRLIPSLVQSPSCAHSLLRSFIRLHGVNHNLPFPTATSLQKIFTSFTIFIFYSFSVLSPKGCFQRVDKLVIRNRNMPKAKALKKSTGGRYWRFFADYIWALPTFNNRWGVLFRCRWGAGVWWWGVGASGWFCGGFIEKKEWIICVICLFLVT